MSVRLRHPFLVVCVACGGGGSATEPLSTTPTTTTSADDLLVPYGGLVPEQVLRNKSGVVDHLVESPGGQIAAVGTTPTELQLADGTHLPFSNLDGERLLTVFAADGSLEVAAQAEGLQLCRGRSGDQLLLAASLLRDGEFLGIPAEAGELLLVEWSPQDGATELLREATTFPVQLSCAATGWVALVTSDGSTEPSDVRTFSPEGDLVHDYSLSMNFTKASIGDQGELVVTGWYTNARVGPHRIDHYDEDSQDSLAIAIDAGGEEMWHAVVSGGLYDQSLAHTLTDDGTLVWVAGEATANALIFDGTGARHQPVDVLERYYVMRLDLATGALLAVGQTETPMGVPLDRNGLTALLIDTRRYPGPLLGLPNESGAVMLTLDEQLQPLAAQTLLPEPAMHLNTSVYYLLEGDTAGIWVGGPTYLRDDDYDTDLPVAAARIPLAVP